MIKKLLLTIFFIMIFTQATFTQEVSTKEFFKITSVNFDTSNSMLFLTSPDNTTEAIMKNIKLIKLEKPKRAYFDINSAVLTSAPQNWFLNSGGVKQVKISQFSTNPSKIRVVLFLDEDFDMTNLSFLKVNNNIVVKFGGGLSKNEYFQQTYRDEKASSSDFYEKLSITSEEIEKTKLTVVTKPSDEALNQIQQSFKAPPATTAGVKPTTSKAPESINKELKLKSKYYVNVISPKENGFLLSGFGVVGVEKPMYLTNPARVVFDIPNAIINPSLKTQEFKIGQDSVKIGQYETNKARIVITSTELEKYFPIYSSDGQSILFSKTETVDLDSLFSKTTDAVAYYVKEINPLTEEIIIAFNAPVVHSVRRDSANLTMNFYNALRYNDQNFKNAVKETGLSAMKIDLLPQVGLKLSYPLEQDSVINCYLGADGKSIKIIVKGVKPRPKTCSSVQAIVLPKCAGKKSVILDAGHGGSDYGAIRAGINEKDITLDVTRRVQAILASKGVTTAMCRDKDEFVSLQDRTTFSASHTPDIFVSIHVNSSVKPEITGVETHYYHQESLELAQTVHACLVSNIKSKDRGLFKSKFYVINHTEVPAVLVEIGFMSNDAERADLVSEQRKQQTAKSIADGILKYLKK